MATPLERIRAATLELHQQLETQTYSRALLDGSLPIALYASFLRALWILHGELEQALERAREPALRAVFDPASLKRRALLERDLAYLQVDLEQIDGAAREALVLARTLRLGAAREPSQLLGFAYVLEGSQLGGLVQCQALRLRPELQDGGLSYLAGAGTATRARFGQFVARLELALRDDASVTAAIAGAQATFAGFACILGAVAPERIAAP
ncbi:MAG: biliverdin-producing heme oxygenase [Myxococcaceae bacterium]|nr:biliverdin-producing heme oxygenase [Myxococcaceae bacterium]